MKKFIQYIKDFHKEYFDIYLYVKVILFVTILLVFNYTLDFEDRYIDKFYGNYIRIPLFFLYHGIAFYGVYFIIWLHDKKRVSFSKGFWIKSALGLLILSIDRSIFPQFIKLVMPDTNPVTYRFMFKVLFNVYGIFTILMTMLIMKLVFDRKENYGIYGLRFTKVDYKAYFLMLLIMVPIVFAATMFPDFLDYYPTYKRTGGAAFARFHKIPEYVSMLIYETIYLFDFINTELFFRGFLVIGLSKLMGKNVILPMAAAYVVLHFGKPIGESISSFFGGYILGVIALYSKNIWGGVFVHGGIAFLMELFAFLRQ